MFSNNTNHRIHAWLYNSYDKQWTRGTCARPNWTRQVPVPPVVHYPRRVPVALREPLKEELDTLIQQGIIAKVDRPTDWVNSCVCVTKPNGKLRLCLDPKDLNKAIKRPDHYTPTLDDVLPKLNVAQFFTILDARSGYLNIKLDEESSYHNLPFFGNLAEKASCVDNKTVLFCYTLFINCFPVICVKSVSQRDTAVSSHKRSKSVLDRPPTDNPYQVACLLYRRCGSEGWRSKRPWGLT